MADNNLVFGTHNSDIILGTNDQDIIQGWAGNDTINASQEDDIIFGGIGIDTYDYNDLLEDGSITVSLDLVFENISVVNSSSISIISRVEIAVDKDLLHRDIIIDTVGEINLDDPIEPIIGTIIAPIAGDNTFQADASSFGGFIDLSQNLYIFDGAANVDGSVEFTIENFVNAIGSKNRDRLIGNSEDNRLEGRNQNDFLNGGAGSDTLVGGQGNDTLVGSSSLLQDKAIDVLNGGQGADLFILGDAEGTFYQSDLENDWAKIQNFTDEDKIQLSPNDTYLVQNSDERFELLVVKETGTDLIAKITTDDTISDILLEQPFQIESGETFGIFIGTEV